MDERGNRKLTPRERLAMTRDDMGVDVGGPNEPMGERGNDTPKVDMARLREWALNSSHAWPYQQRQAILELIDAAVEQYRMNDAHGRFGDAVEPFLPGEES